ncbi:hypothetical protein [Streptomyces auratus]|uniref:Uncharacterized protein n=1 Tax=Streptomyces auratus AGR0001 TaxID=1160718 RepID=A0A8B1PF83_9ACTN|nr:hypothetical protein [Streptomyces auratus]QTZ95362.1 hypothetical protein SU9_031125 [Streptomyces auratus AGR0001]
MIRHAFLLLPSAVADEPKAARALLAAVAAADDASATAAVAAALAANGARS